MNTGLQCTSLPLRFSVHAISSKADSKILGSYFVYLFSDEFYFLSTGKSGIIFLLNMNTGFGWQRGSILPYFVKRVGNTFHLDSFGRTSLIKRFFKIDSVYPSVHSDDVSFFKFFKNHSAIEGVSGIRSLNKVMSVPSSCSAACRK